MPASTNEPRLDGIRILVVDDNEDFRRREADRTIPLIALTAGDDRRRALDAGFLAFLQKPPVLDERCDTIIGGVSSSGKSTRA